jgi:PAS domain S-box-containing protein
MISTFWDIPGIRSKKSLEFLVKLLDPICVYDEQGQTVYASPPFLELLRTDSNQVGFFDYFVSESTKLLTLMNSWERALQGETIWFLAKAREGQEDIECSLQFNSETKLMFLVAKRIHLQAYTRELTEEYERWILALFNHPSLAIALISLEGMVVNSNQRLHELLGTNEAKAIYLEKLVHPEDQRIDLELKRKLLQGEIESYTVEKRFITAENEVIWLNVSASLITVPACINKHKKYFAVLLEDVTENKKIYSALIRTEGKWKAFVLNNLNLFIQTSSGGQIIYASPAVERLLGYRGEELLDCHVCQLIHPDDLNEDGKNDRVNGPISISRDSDFPWLWKLTALPSVAMTSPIANFWRLN